jgi:hypothetical protein
LAEFGHNWGNPSDLETVVLYLSERATAGESGGQIERRLQRLDLGRRLAGETPWRSKEAIQRLLQGVHAQRPRGEGRGHFKPLYREDVHVLVSALRRPSLERLRARAAHLLKVKSGLPESQIARLTWSQLRVGKTRVAVRYSTRSGRGVLAEQGLVLGSDDQAQQCLVSALRAIYVQRDGPLVFGTSGTDVANIARIHRYLSDPDWQRPPPSVVRDVALILIAFHAGLRTGETTLLRHLCQGPVRTAQGRS